MQKDSITALFLGIGAFCSPMVGIETPASEEQRDSNWTSRTGGDGLTRRSKGGRRRAMPI